MPKAAMLADIKAFFALPTWQPEPLLQLLTKYDATPEVLKLITGRPLVLNVQRMTANAQKIFVNAAG